jgi:AcrR family transcriptional regulator
MNPRGRPITLSDDRLLDTARDVFLARGLDATTAEIAQRARISESVIFYRYKTKEALFLAVCEREIVMPPAIKRLASVVGVGEIAARLFEVGADLVERMQATLPFMMMAFSGSPKMAKYLRQPHPLRVQIVRQLSGYFEAELRLGRLQPIDPEILARTFLGGVMQYVMAEYLERAGDRLPLPPATYLRGMIDILLEGAIAKKKAPAARARGRRARS